MKVIETNGITHLEKLDESQEWYWGTDYACGDLWEAEQAFLDGKRFEPNRLVFVRYPDGTVFEPIKAQEDQYFGRPAYIDGAIHILLVDFEEKLIRILRCSQELNKISVVTELPLKEVKDCYNLMLDGPSIVLRRQGWENRFQIIWPEKVDFCIGNKESFLYREGDKLYFSEWHEDPDNQKWVLR